ncbi:helix-turn-helix transcriptional regulator [Aureimonas sp. Leaf454]|uniref:helix-turn-helix transcriptional regulator n=1 Tax=Aureimonas sp. Leaf454 TaxID=1736381 RepID=UPI000ADA761B|nr:helix-turn-helix transcriptional regulator [Aureimonas sp. Leaf454]
MSPAKEVKRAPYEKSPLFFRRVETLRQAEELSASGLTPLEFRPRVAGAFDLAFDGGQSGHFSIWTTRSLSGFVTTPFTNVDVVSIRFVSSGRLLRRDGSGDEVLAQPGLGLLQSFSPVRMEEMSENFAAIAATVDRRTLAAHYNALEGGEPGSLPDFAAIADTRIPGVRAFMRSLLLIHERIRADRSPDGIEVPLLHEIMLYQFLGAWPRNLVKEPGRSDLPQSRRIRLALDFIEANIAGRLKLADVAQACDVSVRTLQMLFKREMGTSVVQVIIDGRLDRVHADLLRAANSPTFVNQIARRWGFQYMGDFSRRYRARFGCTPSETLRTRHH